MDSVELIDPLKSNGSTEVEASSSTTPTQPSKNAQKKAAKAARYAAQKLERRAKEKEAKKEKKRIKAQKRAAGELEEDEAQADEEKRRATKRAKTGVGQKPFRATICIDLGFDDMMADKEIISLSSQLAYTYSANRRSTNPFSYILFTSVNGRTHTRLEGINKAGYKRWANTEWWQEGYERLWSGEQDGTTGGREEGKDEYLKVAKENVIYLTADSEEELLELKEGEVYIIGGICDHNRYKNLCLNKAKGSDIRTARLPIGRYLASLTTRKVLTVNQVVEILLRWVETRDWAEALYAVIPKRKFVAGANNENGDGEEDAGEDEEQDQANNPEAQRETKGVEEIAL